LKRGALEGKTGLLSAAWAAARIEVEMRPSMFKIRRVRQLFGRTQHLAYLLMHDLLMRDLKSFVAAKATGLASRTQHRKHDWRIF
jgi:hypothetical protein